MMGVCLLNSVSASVSQRLDKDKDKWFFKNRGGKDGLIIFKLLMQYSLQTTRYGSETTKAKLHNLNVQDFGNNVADMLLHRKILLDDIQAQGEVFHEDLFWAFKCLETVEEPNAFVRYIEDQKNKWEDGADLTADKLCHSAETKFKLLSEAGKWKMSTLTTKTKGAVKSTEDDKFLALAAAVKELARNNSSQSSKPSDNKKSKWKFEPLAAGASIKKEVNGKLFWWCDGSGGKHHKAMYCHHKPSECKEQVNAEKKQQPSSDTSNKKEDSAPKLKLNNNLATALAALDKVLKTSTNSDDEDDEKDFA
jgi:hypothetical protein